MNAQVALIVAMTRERVIGRDNKLPWHVPKDLKRFKALTLGRPIIMGRKTFESIGRPLPGRLNIVISRNPALRIEGCRVVTSLAEALALAKDDLAHAAQDGPRPEAAAAAAMSTSANVPAPESEIFVIGGGEIFSLALPLASKLYLTWIENPIEGDSHFPKLDLAAWETTFNESHEDNGLQYHFTNYVRKAGHT